MVVMKFIYIFSFLIFISTFANAQNTSQIRISSPFASSTPSVVQGKNTNEQDIFVQLMGVKPLVENKYYEVTINTLIQDKGITCKIFDPTTSPAIAQCLNHQDQDIALSLIEKGIGIVDRTNLKNPSLKSIYVDAQYYAEQNNVGLWPILKSTQKTTTDKNDNNAQVQYYIEMAITLVVPLIGFGVIAIVMYGGFQRLIKLQKYQIASAQQRDRDLREKEKFIVAASLEGEINANRAKLDAFILIYEELLRNLRDPSKEPKYKKSGDIIHKSPALSRNVFDSNMDKMDLLGPSIVTDLTKLYINIDSNPRYETFEPETPVEDVIAFVSEIIRNAEKMLEPLDQVAGALNIIVRNKKK